MFVIDLIGIKKKGRFRFLLSVQRSVPNSVFLHSLTYLACPQEKRTEKPEWEITSSVKPRPPSGLMEEQARQSHRIRFEKNIYLDIRNAAPSVSFLQMLFSLM